MYDIIFSFFDNIPGVYNESYLARDSVGISGYLNESIRSLCILERFTGFLKDAIDFMSSPHQFTRNIVRVHRPVIIQGYILDNSNFHVFTNRFS